MVFGKPASHIIQLHLNIMVWEVHCAAIVCHPPKPNRCKCGKCFGSKTCLHILLVALSSYSIKTHDLHYCTRGHLVTYYTNYHHELLTRLYPGYFDLDHTGKPVGSYMRRPLQMLFIRIIACFACFEAMCPLYIGCNKNRDSIEE